MANEREVRGKLVEQCLEELPKEDLIWVRIALLRAVNLRDALQEASPEGRLSRPRPRPELRELYRRTEMIIDRIVDIIDEQMELGDDRGQ